MTAGIVYCSDGRLPANILRACQQTVLASGLPIVAVTLAPLPGFDHNIMLPLARGYLTLARQQLAGLEALPAAVDTVFMAEHDVLYPPEHFAFAPPNPDTYWYNGHVWKLRLADGHAVAYDCRQVSGLCADRELLLAHYRRRVAALEAGGSPFRIGFEPGCCSRKERLDRVPANTWHSAVPLVDIRHGGNLTTSRWSPSEFRNGIRSCPNWREGRHIPGWGDTDSLLTLLRESYA